MNRKLRIQEEGAFIIEPTLSEPQMVCSLCGGNWIPHDLVPDTRGLEITFMCNGCGAIHVLPFSIEVPDHAD